MPDVSIPQELIHNKSRVADIVAVALICISSVLLLLGLKDYPTLHQAKNDNRTFLLNDSSEVTLKPGSAIKVSGHYEKETRTVYLYGDAHFRVQDNETPFIVKTGNMEVNGIGNSVLIKSGEGGQNSEVLVLKGSVLVTPLKSPWRAVSIGKGQKAIIDPQGRRVTVQKFDSLNALAWKEKILVFNKTRMEDVIPALEEYFKVRIELDNPDIAECRLSRTFREPNVMEVIDVLRHGLGIKVTREPGLLILEGKGCKPSRR